jgi:dephospho-CoA kinase
VSYVVGLTGGIGSGKSAAAELFAALGAMIVDTDAIAHEMTVAGGAAMPEIVRAFGHGILTADGALDRSTMRQLVFNDPAARRQLEEILHPLIRQTSDCRIASADFSAPEAYVVLVVPLLVESKNYRDRVDRIAVVDCREETQIQRVMARNAMTREEVLRILAAQAARQVRLAAANDVIDNDGELALLSPQIAALDAIYRSNTGVKSQKG